MDTDLLKGVDNPASIPEITWHSGFDFNSYLNQEGSKKTSVSSSVFLDGKHQITNELSVEQTLSTVFNRIESEVAGVRSDQMLNFNIELPGGRNVDVKSELRDYSWNFSLSTDNRKLRSQLIGSKKSMSSSLRKSLGRRVYIDIV